MKILYSARLPDDFFVKYNNSIVSKAFDFFLFIETDLPSVGDANISWSFQLWITKQIYIVSFSI